MFYRLILVYVLELLTTRITCPTALLQHNIHKHILVVGVVVGHGGGISMRRQLLLLFYILLCYRCPGRVLVSAVLYFLATAGGLLYAEAVADEGDAK